MQSLLDSIYDAVLRCDAPGTEAGVRAALEAGVPPQTILDDALIAAMGEVGALFEDGEIFVPEMIVAARAMKAGLAILQPLLVDQATSKVGRVAIGTVQGDIHDIGKNLVGMMLEGAGFEIVDLGVNVPTGKFVEAIRDANVDVLAMSALLTTTMPNMAAVIKAAEAAGVRDQVKVIVGGAPVTEEYAKMIGADGYARDASQAASLAKTMMV